MRRRLALSVLTAGSALPWLAARARAQRSSGSSMATDATAAQVILPLPPPLAAGSTIVAIAPGTWWDDAGAQSSLLLQRLESNHWRLRDPAPAMGRWRWFSAPDQERLARLDAAFRERAVDALFCVSGGWGSARLLELGWRPPSQPRWLVGFSDASALLLAQTRAGVGGAIHGSTGGSAEQWQRLVRLLTHQPVEPLQGVGWGGGTAQGPLVVTNLTVATHLIGTPWFPDLRGCVLVIEDTGEAPYRIDRMLTQWRSSGVLRGVAGIGIGRFRWAEDDVLPGDLNFHEVFKERLGSLGVPVVEQLPVGHGGPNFALPLGRPARLDGRSGLLSLL